MSDKEQALLKHLAEMPEELQDKFVLMAQGAALAVECSKTTAGETKVREGEEEEGGAA